MEIRERKLYRIEGEKVTFEAYCRDRWKMSIRYADKIMLAAETADNIKNNTPTGVYPTKERQVRPLTKLEPEQQPTAWKRAVEDRGRGQPTAKQVQEAVNKTLYPAQAETAFSEAAIQAEAEIDGKALWRLKCAWKKATKKGGMVKNDHGSLPQVHQ